MLLNLPNGALLSIYNDKPDAIGFSKQRPSRKVWLETKNQVEELLGYVIVEWGAFVNPATKIFWTEIGDMRACCPGSPRLEDSLSDV